MNCHTCGGENPPEMKFCGGCGRPLLDHQREAAERRHMTVMFCDLAGSTQLAEELDPEDLRDVFVAYQKMCTRAIERCGGYTAKYMGDGLLVYFGYPVAHEDDPQRAIRAGLGILEGLAELNGQLEVRFGISLRGRIGVHTGLVVAGEMGAGDTREEYAIVGETPNIAARLEAVAEPGSIAISQATQRLIAGYFDTEALGPLPLKGVSRSIEVYRVVRDTGAVNRLDVAGPGRLTPLVGREDELDRLLRPVGVPRRSGEGGAVHISGSAGIGKSRVARALHDRVDRRRAHAAGVAMLGLSPEQPAAPGDRRIWRAGCGSIARPLPRNNGACCGTAIGATRS